MVGVTLTNGASAIYYIHPQTWQIVRSTSRRRHHAYEENEKRIETVWCDFRMVGCYVFPFVETKRDIDAEEVLSGGAAFFRIDPNFIVDEATFSLEGG